MRCEDCLPLIEEFFDGEVTTQTGASVRAHLSSCADCSAALDALSFEQEIYARYDRGGLEVTPDLWARVSAEIARTPPVPDNSPAAGRPFLSRARDYVAAALGTFAARPALASSLALALVAAAAGTLWLSRRTPPDAPAEQLAVNTPNTRGSSPAVIPTVPEQGGVEGNPKRENPFASNEGEIVPATHETREAARELTPEQRLIEIAEGDPATNDEMQLLLSAPSAPAANPGLVVIKEDEHPDETTTAAAPLVTNASAADGDMVATDTRPLDPDEKGVARHVERAQMLLRSIKNVRASEVTDDDIAYEKTLSRQLLAENSTLQLEAEVKGDKETKQVLDQIEPFLLEIANMGDKPSREEVRSLRERVRKNEIVAALEVY
ncbi:MAG: zf-HC2 domain-containing protein [Pyrinomonadaceae bacterium]